MVAASLRLERRGALRIRRRIHLGFIVGAFLTAAAVAGSYTLYQFVVNNGLTIAGNLPARRQRGCPIGRWGAVCRGRPGSRPFTAITCSWPKSSSTTPSPAASDRSHLLAGDRQAPRRPRQPEHLMDSGDLWGHRTRRQEVA
jgi:hypothetical protein